MMNKYFEKSPYLVLFILGWFFGRMTTLSKPQKIVAETHTESVSAQKSEVLTQATTNKSSTTGQETIIVKKSYSRNGKLKSETTHITKSAESAMEESKVDKSEEVHLLTFDKSDTKTETSYQYDWLVGLSIPVSHLGYPQDYRIQDFKATVAYRVFDSSYIFVQSNYKLKTAEVGFLFPL